MKHSTTQEEVKMLTDAYNSNIDVFQVGKLIGMSERTIRRWLSRIQENNGNPPFLKPKGGNHNSIVTEEIENFMVRLIEERSDITLEEICLKTLERFPHIPPNKLCIATVWNHLDCKLITTKQIRYVSWKNTFEILLLTSQQGIRLNLFVLLWIMHQFIEVRKFWR